MVIKEEYNLPLIPETWYPHLCPGNHHFNL